MLFMTDGSSRKCKREAPIRYIVLDAFIPEIGLLFVSHSCERIHKKYMGKDDQVCLLCTSPILVEHFVGSRFSTLRFCNAVKGQWLHATA